MVSVPLSEHFAEAAPSALPRPEAIGAVPGTVMKSVQAWEALPIGTFIANVPPTAVYNPFGGRFAMLSSTGRCAVRLDLPNGSVLRRIDLVTYNSPDVTDSTFPVSVISFEADGAQTALTSIPVVAKGSTAPAVVTTSRTYAHPITPGRAVMVAVPAAGFWGFVSLAYHYTPALGDVFRPLTPTTVYDSRKTSSVGNAVGSLGHGQSRAISMANAITATGALKTANVVPAGARAVAYNIRVTSVSGAGGVSVYSAALATSTGYPPAASWWAGGQVVSNGLLVGVNASRQCKVTVVGNAQARAHVAIDVLGYYL